MVAISFVLWKVHNGTHSRAFIIMDGVINEAKCVIMMFVCSVISFGYRRLMLLQFRWKLFDLGQFPMEFRVQLVCFFFRFFAIAEEIFSGFHFEQFKSNNSYSYDWYGQGQQISYEMQFSNFMKNSLQTGFKCAQVNRDQNMYSLAESNPNW